MNDPSRVLVVDDIEDIAKTTVYLLESFGYTAAFLTNPIKTLDRVREFNPHIVILDIGMPTLSGWDVAKILRQHYPRGSLCIFALTAYANQDDMARSKQIGIDRHLLKPLHPQILRTCVSNCLALGCD